MKARLETVLLGLGREQELEYESLLRLVSTDGLSTHAPAVEQSPSRRSASISSRGSTQCLLLHLKAGFGAHVLLRQLSQDMLCP